MGALVDAMERSSWVGRPGGLPSAPRGKFAKSFRCVRICA